MTPQELKNSILQLAIQGKLVEQHPEEGMAEDLYRQIQAEKNALIKAGKLKKEKPLPEITEDEKPFDIPESWMWVRIGKVFSLQAGKNITSADIYENSSPEHPFKCFGGNGCRGYVSDFNRSGHFAVIGRQGALCGNINYAEGDFYATEHAVVVEQFAGTSVLWCGYFLTALNLNQYATATAQPGLAVASINQVLIPLPPIAEQKRIVAKIEELLPLIDRYEQAWTRLEDFNKRFPSDMQKSLLQLAIQGKLVEQRPEEGTGEDLYRQIQTEKQALIKSGKLKKDKPLPEISEDEKPFDIPDSWKWVRLPNVASMCLGKMLDKQKNRGINCPYLRNVNVRWERFDLSDLLEMRFDDVEDERFLIKMDDIVMCEGGEPGRCAVWKSETPMHFQKALHRIRFCFGMIPELYQYCFRLYSENGIFSSIFTGTTIKHLTGQALEKVVIPLPPVAEQKRIIAKLKELLPLCDKLK